MPDLSDRIDALCANWAGADRPGLVLAVVQNGQTIYRKAFGMANLEHTMPIGFDTVFEAASLSKQVTAFAVHLLIGSGQISFDDDVRIHVPELHDFGEPITVRHLMHHTSGLREWVPAMMIGGRLLEDLSETDLVMRWLVRQRRLNHPPGAEFRYTDTGYFLLAEIISRVSGGSFAGFCRANIFDPLGMTTTHFRETVDAVIDRRADSYRQNDFGAFVPCISSQAVPGATSMQTTIDDMVRWLRNFETRQVGGKALVKAMHRSGVLTDGQETRYGSGVSLGTYRGEDIVHHAGGWACYNALLLRMPARNLAIALLSNARDLEPYDFWPPLVDLLLDCEAGNPQPAVNPTPQPSTEEIHEVIGCYASTGGPVIEIREEDGTLKTGVLGGFAVEMIPVGGLRFRVTGFPNEMAFYRNASGEISHYLVWFDGLRQPPRTRITPVTEPINLTDYTGRFYSDELETSYTLIAKDEVLVCASIVHGEVPLRHVGQDLFMATDLLYMPAIVVFERDSNGIVVGLSIGVDGARQNRFGLLPR